MSRTVAVVLANEPGSGFAGPKYLGDIGGVTLIDRVLGDISHWPVDDTVVVLGPDAEHTLDGSDQVPRHGTYRRDRRDRSRME